MFFFNYLQFLYVVHEMFMESVVRERNIPPQLISSLSCVWGCWIITPLQFMAALGQEPARARRRRAFQHMASRAMIVICSDSQVRSVFI